MKVLFVCKENVGRSEIAEAFFRKYAPSHQVRSAGTVPAGKEKLRLNQIHGTIVTIIQAMKEEGVDISKNHPKRLRPEDLLWADRVVVMAQKESWPDYLSKAKNLIYWPVTDPKDVDPVDVARIYQIKNQIKRLVLDLIKGLA